MARVATGAVIEGRDVLEDGQAGLLARAVAVLVDEFGLEGVEAALGHGIVETAAWPTGAGDGPMRDELVLDTTRQVRTASIGVDEKPRRRPAKAMASASDASAWSRVGAMAQPTMRRA
jgi:hypothetical protein